MIVLVYTIVKTNRRKDSRVVRTRSISLEEGSAVQMKLTFSEYLVSPHKPKNIEDDVVYRCIDKKI